MLATILQVIASASRCAASHRWRNLVVPHLDHLDTMSGRSQRLSVVGNLRLELHRTLRVPATMLLCEASFAMMDTMEDTYDCVDASNVQHCCRSGVPGTRGRC